MKKLYHKIDTINGSIITLHAYNIALGELVRIHRRDKTAATGFVFALTGAHVSVLVHNAQNISSDDSVEFLGHGVRLTSQKDLLLGRSFNGVAEPVDNRPVLSSQEQVSVVPVPFNLYKRAAKKRALELHHPMIDLVDPISCGESIAFLGDNDDANHGQIKRVIEALDPDVIVAANFNVKNDQAYEQIPWVSSYRHKVVSFVHGANEPLSACLQLLDFALCAAEQFALSQQRVLVVFSNISVWCDALKEHHLRQKYLPTYAGYPHHLRAHLAARFDKACALDNTGSITLVATTTQMPALKNQVIESLIGAVTDHHVVIRNDLMIPRFVNTRVTQPHETCAYLAQTLLTWYAKAQKHRERQARMIDTSPEDKLLQFARAFEQCMMTANLTLNVKEQLAIGFRLLQQFIPKEYINMDYAVLEHSWRSAKVQELDHDPSSIHAV